MGTSVHVDLATREGHDVVDSIEDQRKGGNRYTMEKAAHEC